ncbi:hypothetical protein [Kitasatospora sp. NPDC057223]|uniref:hypothetical protein n=1 Tax=Kitasatospora sp. NPDC057223 TaxID=3346055 RepID=UPI003634391D
MLDAIRADCLPAACLLLAPDAVRDADQHLPGEWLSAADGDDGRPGEDPGVRHSGAFGNAAVICRQQTY